MTNGYVRPSTDDGMQAEDCEASAMRPPVPQVPEYRRPVTQPLDAPRVVIVIPTFRPPLDLPERVELLSRDVAHVVVVDDGTGSSADDVLGMIERHGHRVARLRENSGIAAALNSGIAIAGGLGATHVLTLDQDSSLEPHYVELALAALRELAEMRVGTMAVAAGTVDGTTLSTSRRRGRFSQVHETLQSGLVFPAGALRAAGPFDESLFIDCVDSDMLLRGAERGLGTYFVPECRLAHRLGEPGVVALPGGRRLEFAYHGPERRYYITRNRTVLEMRFGRRFPRWGARQLIDQTQYFAYCLLFGHRRGLQLLAAAAGLLHAATGRRGRIPPRLASLLQKG